MQRLSGAGKRVREMALQKIKKMYPDAYIVKTEDFFDEPITSSRVLFIIDISGSMMVRDPIVEKGVGPERDKDGKLKKGRTGVEKKEPPKGKGKKIGCSGSCGVWP